VLVGLMNPMGQMMHHFYGYMPVLMPTRPFTMCDNYEVVISIAVLQSAEACLSYMYAKVVVVCYLAFSNHCGKLRQALHFM